MQLYFQRHDGDAVTIDDFVASMADANDFNFEPFMSWYSKSGTPEVEVIDEYDSDSKIYRATFTQKNQHEPFIMPNAFGLLDDNGSEVASGMVLIDELEKTVEFDGIKSKPTPSWFRGLSAPIKFNSNLTVSDKLYLCANDTDPYNRWDSIQGLWLDYILTPEKIDQKGLFEMLKKLLQEESDLALLSEMMTLPSERIIHQKVGKINVAEVNQKRENVNFCVIKYLEEILLSKYKELNHNKTFDLSTQSIGERALKNRCLSYLVKSGEYELAYKQFNHAKCMSDQLSSFQALVENHNPYQKEVIERFYELHHADVQTIDRWFSVQSMSPSISVAGIRELMSHKLFTMKNPNRVRSVFGAFAQNHIQFHCQEGYQLMTEVIIELDALNPQIAARFASVFNHWRRFTSHYSKLQKAELKTISGVDNLSNNVYEIVHIALEGKT
jgi:aminopeptidase N